MKTLSTIAAVLTASAFLLAFISVQPASAQCQGGGMMGMCTGGEGCHEPGEMCTEENCPSGGMMGSCMSGEECSTGMMGGMGENCHEPGGGSGGMMGCHMEETCDEMSEYCEATMHEQCGESHDFCEKMSQRRRNNVPPGPLTPINLQIHGSPNPFNPVTILNFSLPEASPVDLAVYDINGRQVAVLASDYLEAGDYSLPFSGENLPTGVYLAKMEALGTVSVTKLLLLK